MSTDLNALCFVAYAYYLIYFFGISVSCAYLIATMFGEEMFSERNHRSYSAQGLMTSIPSPVAKLPMPPGMWIADKSDYSSESSSGSSSDLSDIVLKDDRSRVRSRYKKYKNSSSVPIGFFWDIENCQVPRGCSAIDVVSSLRAKFLAGRREADFVVVCDVRKEQPNKLQELNDAQVSLIHVCGTQKNAADEKLRQCMRRFGELHSAPAALVLISGDINFAADLSDFRYRKNMDVILVHKQHTSSALIACATSHYNYSDITADLPRTNKNSSQSEPEEECSCELEVFNLPLQYPTEKISRRLKRLADNCGGKVLKVTLPTALLRFPTPDHTSRALKRMNGEDVFGRRIGTRNVPIMYTQPAYSSDEGYATAPAASAPQSTQNAIVPAMIPTIAESALASESVQRSRTPQLAREWALAIQQLPTPPPAPASAPIANNAPNKPRQIRGTHGSNGFDLSGSTFSADDSRTNGRAISPWNSSLSEHSSDSEINEPAELTVSNLPIYNAATLKEMISQLFSQFVPVISVSVWGSGESTVATVMLKSEWDARLLIARIHKRKLEQVWTGRRLELSIGRPSPILNLDILRARLRAILLDQPNLSMPLLRLRDAYASRHCCALTTADITKVRDTVVIQENFGRIVQLIDLSPSVNVDLEETTWRCNVHGLMNMGQDDGSRILTPIFMELTTLAKHTHKLLENHGGMLPLLSFVDCYEATFSPLVIDKSRGVALELLLRSIPSLIVKDTPLRHITWNNQRNETPSPVSHRSGGNPRTAPSLEPVLSLFERELIDLLKIAPKATIQFSKLIPAYHHHYARQCRVAEYGFTKLPDLLAALTSTIAVLGSGSSRVVTLTASVQARRWTSDLVKLLRTNIRPVYFYELPQLYQITHARPFLPADYGLCTLNELMQRVTPNTVMYCSDGSFCLPKRSPTQQERARTGKFAAETVEMLCSTPNLRLEFARFVPAYHSHFGRQLRVGHYGCVKLIDLLDLIPDTVYLRLTGGEKFVHLTLKPARAVLAQRIAAIAPLNLNLFTSMYANKYGAPPLPDMLDVNTIEELILSAGGYIDNMIVRAPGDAPKWVTAALMACAVLSSDKSIAKGSSTEFFTTAFKDRFGSPADIEHLESSGVISCQDGRIMLSNVWRLVWRVGLLLSQNASLNESQICAAYVKRYEPVMPYRDIGFKSALDFVRYFRDVFAEDDNRRFSVCAGVVVPQCLPPRAGNFTDLDTPPGCSGTRVFESPQGNIWRSPPASTLPAPLSLLHPENKRRTRLAAQFNAA